MATRLDSTECDNPGQNDAESMQKMFGQLSTEDKQGSGASKVSSASDSKSSDAPDSGKIVIQPGQSRSISSVNPETLIPSPSVQTKFDVDNYCPCIACVDQGLAWVQTHGDMLQLIDREGSVKDIVGIDFSFFDIAVTSDGDLLLPDYDNSCIKSLSREKTITTLFRTGGKPTGLCCLHNGDIAVTFEEDSEVYVFSRDGKIRRKLDHIKFRCPMKITENNVNQDIYVCDHERGSYVSPGKMIAAGADGKIRYEYTGQGDSTFTPVEVCTDQMGHVLITDHGNHRVHILDQEGQFIQYVLTSKQGLHLPVTVDVDSEGYVWLGEYTGLFIGRIKVARYLC